MCKIKNSKTVNCAMYPAKSNNLLIVPRLYQIPAIKLVIIIQIMITVVLVQKNPVLFLFKIK